MGRSCIGLDDMQSTSPTLTVERERRSAASSTAIVSSSLELGDSAAATAAAAAAAADGVFGDHESSHVNEGDRGLEGVDAGMAVHYLGRPLQERTHE